MVETEVRRSTKLQEISEGFKKKKHVTIRIVWHATHIHHLLLQKLLKLVHFLLQGGC